MYKIYANDTLIYNDVTPELEQTKLIEPKLTLEDNTAGSFTAKIPQGNACHSTVAPITTTIRITRDDRWIWTGRVLKVGKDFWNQKTIECEGALAFLNDSVIPLAKISNATITGYVTAILNAHNGKVPDSRKIYRGSISNDRPSGGAIGARDYFLEGQTSLSALQTLTEEWGFHFRIRESSSKLYLDVLRDDQLDTTNQQIDFGQNLLDYSDNYDWSDIITAILPLGAKLDTAKTTGDEEHPDRVTIKSVNSNDLYLVNSSAVNKYGRIEKTVEWSDVEDPSTLKQLARSYLNDFQYNEMVLTVKVLDLHYLNASVEAFKFLSQINVVSKPHGLNKTFVISRMEIPFDQPENTTFEFSRSTMGSYGADKGAASFRGNGTISGASSQIAPREGILKEARENATSMISMATNGYVTLVPASNDPTRTQSLVISNMIDPEQSTRKWTWNVNGLMHQRRSSVGDSWGAANVAITMDGDIVATRITTGVLTVDDGRGGILLSADISNHTVLLAGFTVKDTKLYVGKTSLNDNTSGVYVGTNGFSTGSGSNYIAMSSGQIYGGSNGANGYLIFATYATDSGNDGCRIAGRGYVGVITSGWFGISDRWYGKDADATMKSGTSGTIDLVSRIRDNGDGTITWWTHSYYFYKGILNTTM